MKELQAVAQVAQVAQMAAAGSRRLTAELGVGEL